MDIDRLTPAPWKVDNRLAHELILDVFSEEEGGWTPRIAAFINERFASRPSVALRTEEMVADAEFIALARNDLDVKLRRGWHTEKCCTESDDWVVPQAAVLAMQMVWKKNGGVGQVPESLPPTVDVFDNCYQRGHDVGLLTKADAWMREHEGNGG